MRVLISFLFGMALSVPAMAVVDMKNANYADTWNDLVVPGAGFDLRIRRTYNSRTLFSGMFGFGWCSDYETSLDVTPEGTLKLTECGGGLEITYMPKSFNKKEVAATIDKILDDAKKKDRNLVGKRLETLKDEITNNSQKRKEMGEAIGLVSQVKEGTSFLANGQQVESIVYKDKFYTRTLPDGTSQKFDQQGKLAFIYDKNSNFVKLLYNKDELKEVVDNNGRKLTFKFHPSTKKLAEIKGPGTMKASYTFKGEDLAAVTNAWKNRYTYAYDDYHNIKRINYPDGTFKALTYDEDKDWVTSFTDRFKCVETYRYELSEDDPKNHFVSKVEKKCRGEVTNYARYEFWHKARPNGLGTALMRVKTETKNDKVDITYHEVFGRPVSINRNNVIVTFTYYPNGLVQTKVSKFQLLDFEYDKKTSKVSLVNTQFRDEKGKVVRKRKTEFEYDDRGNLSYAANSDGQKVWLDYDLRGRISLIKDQARKTVEITYEEKFGKPSLVKRPGLGTIVFTYTPDGQVNKVDSKQGPIVAFQVASTFNNLLDVIAPATNETSISI